MDMGILCDHMRQIPASLQAFAASTCVCCCAVSLASRRASSCARMLIPRTFGRENCDVNSAAFQTDRTPMTDASSISETKMSLRCCTVASRQSALGAGWVERQAQRDCPQTRWHSITFSSVTWLGAGASADKLLSISHVLNLVRPYCKASWYAQQPGAACSNLAGYGRPYRFTRVRPYSMQVRRTYSVPWSGSYRDQARRLWPMPLS
eukprot:SAG31_NODE_64_length_28590_cov_17.914464_11_plen_207_part_00